MSKKDAARELRDAKRELDRVSRADRVAGRKGETKAYLDANDRVLAAMKNVPWWRGGGNLTPR